MLPNAKSRKPNETAVMKIKAKFMAKKRTQFRFTIF